MMQAPGQPPIGSSPASSPVPNAGHAVKGNQIIGMGLKALAAGVALVGPSGPLGQAVLKALQEIGKHLPPGATTEAGEKNAMESQMMQMHRNGPMMAMLRQQAASQQPPQSPQAPPPQEGGAPM